MDKTLPHNAKTLPMQYPEFVKTEEQRSAFRALYAAYLERRQQAWEALFITLRHTNAEYKTALEEAAKEEESEAGASTTEEAAA